MREKARAFFDEAKLLCAAKKYDGAASRLYYALYHAVIVGFDENGIKQSSLTKKMDHARTDYWLHEVVRGFASFAGVSRRNTWIIVTAWRQRVIADYNPETVDEAKVSQLMIEAKGIFSDVGISI